jgi:glutamate-ammonia-ligase adenylyltransferase
MLTHDNLFSDNRTPSNDEAYVLHAVSCSPFLARMLAKDALLLQDLLDNLYISYKI